MKKRRSFLESVSRNKARQLNHHIIPLLDDNTYDVAAIHVGTNDLLSDINSTKDICKDIIDSGLKMQCTLKQATS